MFTNEIIINSLIGILSGLILIVISFILLNVFKKSSINDFFVYYCYLKSLNNKSKLVIVKDSRIVEFYNSDKALTKIEFINLLASIFNYTPNSLEFKNLINEVNADFAKHSFIDVDIEKIKKIATNRAISFDLVIPFMVNIILIIFVSIYNYDQQGTLRALARLFTNFISIIFTISISMFTYEMLMIKKIKNHNSFNDFFFLSFNNYQFKLLNSSLVKSN